ncbi:MAG: hypothetical protein WCR27_10175 [Eubacteriales bacterium]
MGNSKLLFNKSPLLLDPDLAVLLGLHESIVIQQVHYWLKINEESSRNFHDGHYWTYNSYSEWQKQFPFWNESSVQKIFLRLEKQGYLISGNYNKLKVDRTKWYRINYDKLQTLETPPSCTKSMMQHALSEQPIPEITPQITSQGILKNSERNKGISKENSVSFKDFAERNPEAIFLDDIIPAVEYYLATYTAYTGKNHPNLKESQWQKVVAEILHVKSEYLDTYLELDEIEKMVDKHFITEYENCDFNILHFVNGDIMKNRFFEECYIDHER